MIDLATMKGIRVDPEHRSARAEPGLRLGEFDRACQGFGLATTTGVASDTGIAGLPLGGGIGWLNGKHGLACDNLLSVDIVTADARLRVASPTEDADLFWAVRGAGANFGIVTSFEYREENGTPVVEIAVAWCGSLDEGERLLGRLRSLDVPIADSIASMGYVSSRAGAGATGSRASCVASNPLRSTRSPSSPREFPRFTPRSCHSRCTVQQRKSPHARRHSPIATSSWSISFSRSG
jgi:FAD/FMN-containing dehydrogenase